MTAVTNLAPREQQQSLLQNAAKALIPSSLKDLAFSVGVMGVAVMAGWGTVGVAGAALASRFTKKTSHRLALLGAVIALPQILSPVKTADTAPGFKQFCYGRGILPQFSNSCRADYSRYFQRFSPNASSMVCSIDFSTEEIMIDKFVPLEVVKARKKVIDVTLSLLNKVEESKKWTVNLFSELRCMSYGKPSNFQSLYRKSVYLNPIYTMVVDTGKDKLLSDENKLTIFRNLESLGMIPNLEILFYKMKHEGGLNVVFTHLLNSKRISERTLREVFFQALSGRDFKMAQFILDSHPQMNLLRSQVLKEIHYTSWNDEVLDWVNLRTPLSQRDFNKAFENVVKDHRDDDVPAYQVDILYRKKVAAEMLIKRGADVYYSPETISFSAKAGIFPEFTLKWFREEVPSTSKRIVLDSYLQHKLAIPFSEDLVSEIGKFPIADRIACFRNILSNEQIDPAWIHTLKAQFSEFSSSQQLQILRLTLANREESGYNALKTVARLVPKDNERLARLEADFAQDQNQLKAKLDGVLNAVSRPTRDQNYWQEWQTVAQSRFDLHRDRIRKALEEGTRRGAAVSHNQEGSVFTMPGIPDLIFKAEGTRTAARYERSKYFYDLASSLKRVVVPRSYLTSVDTAKGKQWVMVEEKLPIIDYRKSENSLAEIGRLMSQNPAVKGIFDETVGQAVEVAYRGNLWDMAERNIPFLSDLTGMAMLDTDRRSEGYESIFYRTFDTQVNDSFAARCGLRCLEVMRSVLKAIDPRKFFNVDFSALENEARLEIQRLALQRKLSLLAKTV